MRSMAANSVAAVDAAPRYRSTSRSARGGRWRSRLSEQLPSQNARSGDVADAKRVPAGSRPHAAHRLPVTTLLPTTAPAEVGARLLADGFVHMLGPFATPELAWVRADEVFSSTIGRDAIGAGMPSLTIVGEFTVPPLGTSQRPFQALHIDFGLPLGSRRPADIARFTALHVAATHPPTSADTRLIRLRDLLGQRAWPDLATLRQRLSDYARRQRAADGHNVEGILARLIEAADMSATLPQGDKAGFLCGMEFASLAEEDVFFADHRLDLASVERRVRIRPGELLLFDNLAIAHGRRGTRPALELHQRCVGYPQLDAARHQRLLNGVLGQFRGASR